MRSHTIAFLLLAAGFSSARGQALLCPPAPNLTGRPCETFHYHVQLYRPDARTFTELYGVNQFSSQGACDKARDLQQKRNMEVIEFYRAKRNDTQYQPDRIGTCHCDMTIDKSSPNYLTDAQRLIQLRTAEEIRQKVRERLLDAEVPSDSEILRTTQPPAGVTALAGGPRLVSMPPRTTAADVSRSAEDLKSNRTAETAVPSPVSIELPLVDVVPGSTVAMPSSPPPAATTVATSPSTPPATPASPAPTSPTPTQPPPSPAPVSAAPATPVTTPATTAASAETPVPSAEEAADAFVSYETQRIQHVLGASNAITDESTKGKVLEACMQRIQLLSNLRSLIQGSGARSRLAAAARNARTEEERVALMARLFGSDMQTHWAPKDATDVILPTDADTDPEKILRDSSNLFSDQQKKHALYSLLAHSQPTEEQQLWLITVIDSFLQ